MATRPASPALRYIRSLAATEHARGLADRELLELFSGRQEEAAFAELVRRHGPMVLGLCLRILRNEADAEDAFQATFLVLSRKAASLRPRESLCDWLHSVAYRIAQKARIDAARRRTHEGRVGARPVTDPLAQMTLQEADEVLHRELARLPDKFRAPLVLCYLEGLTRDEAAQRIGWAVSTLKSRLEQARERLRARLASRGLGLSGVLFAGLVGEATVSAAVPPVLLRSTVKAATSVAAGGAAAPVLTGKVAALTQGVGRAMFLSKFKSAAGLGLVVACACALALAQVGAGPVQDVPAKPTAAQASAPGVGGAKAAPRSDAEALQGAWKVVRRVEDGEEHEPPKGAVLRWYFTTDTAYEMLNDVLGGVYSYTLGPKEKPATIDLTSDRHGTTPAIYRLKDDELTLCRPIREREERPTEFDSKAESNLELLVLQRDPKAPKLDLEKVKAAVKAGNERRPVAQAMMQILLAMHAYHDDQGSLPPAALCDGKDKPLLSWRVALLPYLDEEELYKAFKLDEPWDSENNKKLLDKMPAVYGDQGNETVYQVFVGPDTAFPGAKPKQFGDITDGTGNTILLAVAARPVPWTKPADLPYLADKPLPKLGGQFKDGFHVASADGAVFFAPRTFNEKTLRALITIAGGENDTFADLLGGSDKAPKKERQ
jgi:RNA polymerase sigma factor (sigma-70 family)